MFVEIKCNYMFLVFQAHYLSNPVNTERRNRSTGCSADKSEFDWHFGKELDSIDYFHSFIQS